MLPAYVCAKVYFVLTKSLSNWLQNLVVLMSQQQLFNTISHCKAYPTALFSKLESDGFLWSACSLRCFGGHRWQRVHKLEKLSFRSIANPKNTGSIPAVAVAFWRRSARGPSAAQFCILKKVGWSKLSEALHYSICRSSSRFGTLNSTIQPIWSFLYTAFRLTMTNLKNAVVFLDLWNRWTPLWRLFHCVSKKARVVGCDLQSGWSEEQKCSPSHDQILHVNLHPSISTITPTYGYAVPFGHLCQASLISETTQ